MKSYRLNRLFNSQSGKLLDIAVDHGFFRELSFLNGIENMQEVIETLVSAQPDAIQLSTGQAKILQSIPGNEKPKLVFRTDTANVYNANLPESIYCHILEEAVLQAVRLDATCVVVNLFLVPNHPEITEHCIRNILRLKKDCDHYQMPLMIEPIAFSGDASKGHYAVDGDLDKILPLVRQAVELGADLIKADPTENPLDYHKVIQIAGTTPVLARGGSKGNDYEVLTKTRILLDQGARGLVYGRNIIHHENPFGMTKALMEMIHSDLSADDAMQFLK